MIKDSDIVVVHSIFSTIQGEGPFAGRRAIFIRLAGCNLQCPLCDTEYTQGAMPYTPATLVDEVFDLTYPIPELIVITGGEPLRQPIAKLVRHLLARGFTVQVETNGTLYRPNLPYDNPKFHIVCSPKMHTVNPELVPHIKAFKYVGGYDTLDPIDGLPLRALDHPSKGPLFRPPLNHPALVYLQPVDVQDEAENAKHTAAIVRSCQQHGFILCLQLHKIIGLA